MCPISTLTAANLRSPFMCASVFEVKTSADLMTAKSMNYSGSIFLEMAASEYISRIRFGKTLKKMAECQHALLHEATEKGFKVCVLLTSSLTCKYEGNYISPLQIAEEMQVCLQLGADSIILEEAAPGLTPRMMENICKTLPLSHVPPKVVVFSLRNNGDTTLHCVGVAMALGYERFVIHSLPRPSVNPHQIGEPLSAAQLAEMILEIPGHESEKKQLLRECSQFNEEHASLI